jgi:hypothetical protein
MTQSGISGKTSSSASTNVFLSSLPAPLQTSDPLRLIGIIGVIFLLSVLLGVVIPGWLYHACGTFDEKDVLRHLPKEAASEWATYQSSIRDLQQPIDRINNRLIAGSATLSPSDVLALIEGREKQQSALDKLSNSPPFHVSSFYLNSLMFLWPTMYACFACFACLLKLKYPVKRAIGSQLIVFAGVWFVYRLPTWLRNLPPLWYIKRNVYANGNWDVSPFSFIVQEGQALIVSLLLAYIWINLADFFPYWCGIVLQHWKSIQSGELRPQFVEGLTALFIYWQVCSVLLAGAFVPYSLFFWNFVIDFKDQRYLASALIVHGLWGITWLLLSLPLAWSWYQWSVTLKLYDLNSAPGRDGLSVTGEEVLATTNVSSPIGAWNFVGSLTCAVLTFGFPVLKKILE